MNTLKTIVADALLVDVRTPGEFAGGHIEGAINIPLPDLSERKHEMKGLGNSPVVFYCRSGNRSAAAVSLLEKQGYSHVYNGGSIDNLLHLLIDKK